VLNSLASAFAHHLLEQADWARSRLAAHSGKRVRVELPMGPLSVEIAEDGQVLQVELDETPDLVISLTPLATLQWFTDRQAVWREARVEGDAELAAAISDVASNLRWDFEEDLSHVVGDVAAQRVGQVVRQMSTWPGDAAESAARGVAEYLAEENHMLATPLQAEAFARDVDDLRDSVERLEKRIDRLASSIAGSHSR
jgi:ubiquinone biosynthesis accessory factor UbiJ